MSTPYCLSDKCLNGNCEGCKDGSEYCNDPRCYPNCPNCSGKTNVESTKKWSGLDWTLIIIMGVLIVLVIILLIVVYQRWSKNPVKVNRSSSNNIQQPIDLTATYEHYDPLLGENSAQIEINTIPLNNQINTNYQKLPAIPKPEFQKATINLPEIPNPVVYESKIVTPIIEVPNSDTFKYDEVLDTSLNVSDFPYTPPNPITQTSFTSTIPSIPKASIPNITNISVASYKTIPTKTTGLSLNMRTNNDTIKGF